MNAAMFEDLTRTEQYGLIGTAVILLALGFGAGAFTSGGSPTGNVVAPASGDTETAREAVQSYMDQQLQRQRARLRKMVNQSKNLTMDDVSIDAQVVSVEQSRFSDLYRVNVSITGRMPSPLTGGVRDISQNTIMLISKDGRFLFRQPTDLQQPRRRAPTR